MSPLPVVGAAQVLGYSRRSGRPRRGEHLFAPGALALGDELEGQGVTVAYAGDPQYVLILESWEWWGPAILIAQDAVAAFNPTERTIGQTIIRVRP